MAMKYWHGVLDTGFRTNTSSIRVDFAESQQWTGHHRRRHLAHFFAGTLGTIVLKLELGVVIKVELT